MVGYRKVFLLLGMLTFLGFFAKGQDTVCRWVSPSAYPMIFKLDSLTILESSITVKDPRQNPFPFSFDGNTGLLEIEPDSLFLPDSLQICYRQFPYDLSKTYAKRTLEEHYDSMAFFKDRREAVTEAFDFREEIFSSDHLNTTGNLTRGVSFGNAQNVFVNSSLNLQMDGELAENLNIRASITDQNVPFQPEGNTQQIQDFDNVLIELYNDRFSLSAGDVVFQQRQSKFLRYYKNVQGLQFTSDYQVGENWQASTQAGVSIAKGKFASVQLDVLEGVLGPYRVRGPQNERYVIIMANSEKVFLDGKQLKRGFNQDYVIDYNQGEITFTNQVLITQYSRVRVDYEFAERNFTRSIFTANHIQKHEKGSFYLNYYKEQDNRNRPLFFEFSEQDKRLLASVGDSTAAASVPQVDSIAFDPQRILYRKVNEMDSLGQQMEYYEYSTDPDEAVYAVKFLEVGSGNGHYVRKEQLANGFVYEYIPPVNGQPQGNFSIYAPLPAPNKKQMITAGGDVNLSDYEKVYAEVAFSDQDENLFSELDAADNKGFGIKSGISSEGRSIGWMKGYTLNTGTEFEYNTADFTFIDRLRYIEFDRDWSADPELLENPASERLWSAHVEAAKDPANRMSYALNYRKRGEVLTGTQHRAKLDQQLGKRIFTVQDYFLMNSRVNGLDADWLRYQGDIRYQSAVLVPGLKIQVDRNAVKNAESDSVVSTAMNFREHQVYIRSNDTLPYSFFANASWRADRFPVEGELTPDTEAFTTNYGLQKMMGKHDVKGTFTYRKLEHVTRDLPMETTVMGRLDYSSRLFKNNLRNELSYAIGNGRELKREFVYLPVPTGEGTHTWRDDNEDGVRQLNEFYLAVNPEEKNYIKVFTPTDDYIQAYSTLFNYRLHAQFPDDWREEKGIKGLLHKISNTTSWNVEKKITAKDFWSRLSPVSRGIAVEDLVSLRQVFRSTLFFNRSSTLYGFDLSLFDSQNKQLLTGGFEDIQQRDWRFNTRYNFNPAFNLRMIVNTGGRTASSDFLENRNYEIRQWGAGPELTWQPSSFFRTSISYRFTQKENVANTELDEKAGLHELGWDMRYAKAIQTTLNAQLRYTHIDYNGLANSPTGYEMLQALTVGSNLTWNVNWIQKIGEGLQLNLSYEGRNSEGLNRVVHTGRMQVSALF